MKVLVTGATGFTGSHLTRFLRGKGDDVRILVRPESRGAADALGGVEVAEGDVRDPAAVDAAVRGVERVYHLAALFRQAGFPEAVYRDVNVGGTRNVLESAKRHGVARVVHCSTVGVLGHIANPPADETTPYNPGDIYQRTKREGEELALAFHRREGLPLTVVRPAMIWGEGDRRMLKLFRGIARRRFVIVGDGKTFFHFVHIEDLCRGFVLAGDRDVAVGETYILAGGEPVRLDDLSERIARCNGVPPPRLRIPAWPVQALGTLVESVCVPLGIEPPIYRRRVDFFTKHRWFSIEKAREHLDFQPKRTLDEEIERISAWYREHGWYD